MYKYYTAETIKDDSRLAGSRVVKVFFFVSPLTAFQRIADMGPNTPINFRRVK